MFVRTLLSAVIALAFSSTSYATIVIPGAASDAVADSFGSLPAATFGGTGIPNSAVAISQSTIGSNTVTLGLSATPRFSSPNPTNDGMGAFTVSVGESSPGLSLWNFSYYANISGPGTFADYRFELSYDLDSAAATDLSAHGVVSLNGGVVLAGGFPALSSTKTVQGSENAGFAYLTTTIPGVVTAPSPVVSFDPNATGEYTFQLRVYDSLIGGNLVDQVSISVAAIPEPTAALFGALMTTGLGLMIGRRRREGEAAIA